MLVRALYSLSALAGALAVQTLKDGGRRMTEAGAKRFAELSSGEWDNSSLSGPGSRPEVCKPFVDFFLQWLDDHKEVQSMVEVSAGHWPSGWQRFVPWPQIDYTGIDLLEDVIQADNAYVNQRGIADIGLHKMTFQKGDMLDDSTMPKADLLLTKDTIIHFPNADIAAFVNSTVLQCPPKYKYVMFVHDSRKRDMENRDIAKFGEFHGVNLQGAPFNYKAETVFRWRAKFDNKVRVVQIMSPLQYCQGSSSWASDPSADF
jgi:hypothetical protein